MSELTEEQRAILQMAKHFAALNILVLMRAGIPFGEVMKLDGPARLAMIEGLAALDDPEATRLLMVCGHEVPPRLYEMPILEPDACA